MNDISVKKPSTLYINTFDDEFVFVTYLCMFDGKRWFSWNTVTPTVFDEPEYKSDLIDESKLNQRLELLNDYKEFTENDRLAINIFLLNKGT